MCLPKQDWLAQRDFTGVHWPVWGKPHILEYDQGPENEAKGIQRGLRLHGITAKVRAKGHPEHHGTIERLIGTMMRRIHERARHDVQQHQRTRRQRAGPFGLPQPAGT